MPTGLATTLRQTPCGLEIAESFYRNVKGTLEGFAAFIEASGGAGGPLISTLPGFIEKHDWDPTKLVSLPANILACVFNHYSKMIKGVVEGDCGALGDLAFELVMLAVPLDEGARLLKAGVKDFKRLDK